MLPQPCLLDRARWAGADGPAAPSLASPTGNRELMPQGHATHPPGAARGRPRGPEGPFQGAACTGISDRRHQTIPSLGGRDRQLPERQHLGR